MSILFVFLAGFVVHILISGYTIMGAGINLMLLLTVEISLLKGRQSGQFFGFFSGLLEDILSIGLLGEQLIIRTVLGNLLGRFKQNLTVEHILFQVLITFLVFFLHSYAIYLFRIIFSHPSSITGIDVTWYSFINALLAPLVYLVLRQTVAG